MSNESEAEPNRLRYAVCGFVLFAGAILFLGAVWGLSSTYTRNQIQAEEASRDYAERTDREINQRCLRLAPAAMAECITVAVQSSREDQRAERNLEAQQNTAIWTGAMAILAGLGLMLSAGGVGLVYVTFQQARRSADAAQRTYEAFVSVEDASLVVEFGKCHRIEMVEGGKRQPDTYYVPIIITNIGRSTARLNGWSLMGDIARVSFLSDRTLAAGESWDKFEDIELREPTKDFTILIPYSSPVRERMALEVKARLYVGRNALSGQVTVNARVQSTRLRATEQT